MSGADRIAARARFLAEAGWDGAAAAPLAGDASARSYQRLTGGPAGAGAVLMDAPPDRGESLGAFLAMTGLLRGRGLSAPEIVAADMAAGFALIEDLGDDLFIRVAADRPAEEAVAYETAIDLLADLHQGPAPATAEGHGATKTIPPYDAALLTREATLALDWWRKGVLGVEAEPDLADDFGYEIAEACARPETAQSVLTLRDYHAENLLWLPDRAGLARVGLLDYQDALIGAPAYDVVSLLEDARRDVPGALRDAMKDRYAAAMGFDPAAREEFEMECAALSAQRNLKILGLFTRLWLRDGKPAYLNLLPRVWNHIYRSLANKALVDLRRFVEEEIPPPDQDALDRVRAAR